MKYYSPIPKPEWNIKSEIVEELEEAFTIMNRCADKRIELDMKNPKQVESYQFDAQHALDKASNARAKINLVNYYEPIQKEIDRFYREDYLPIEALMELNTDTKEIARLQKFFSTVNSHVKRKNYNPELREKDFMIVYNRCLEYEKRAADLPVQARNMVYLMLTEICCNMNAVSTTIDSGHAPRALFDPTKGHEYAGKIQNADNSKPYIQKRIEEQMGVNNDGTLKLSATQFKSKKQTKRLIIISLLIAAGIIAIFAAVAVIWIAFVIFAFYTVFKLMISDATDRTPSAGPQYGPNTDFSGSECGKCAFFNKVSCPRYPSGHPYDAACNLMNNPTW